MREKLFLEKVMDIEFQDASMTEKAIFYSGNESGLCVFSDRVSLAVVGQLRTRDALTNVRPRHWILFRFGPSLRSRVLLSCLRHDRLSLR